MSAFYEVFGQDTGGGATAAEIVDAIKADPVLSARITVIPLQANGPKRTDGNQIPLFVGELIETTVPTFDGENAPISLTGRTLLLKIETQQREPVASPVVTIAGTSFVFTPTAPVTSKVRVLLWALWDDDLDAILCHGEMPVSYAPQR
jgi:hypothetical protein